MKKALKTQDQRYWNVKRNHGVTLEQYNALYAKQGGVCYICDRPSLLKRLSIDHHHETKRVRGLLCHSCNVLIGFLEKAHRLNPRYLTMQVLLTRICRYLDPSNKGIITMSTDNDKPVNDKPVKIVPLTRLDAIEIAQRAAKKVIEKEREKVLRDVLWEGGEGNGKRESNRNRKGV